jgi:hypothetical protein
MNILIKYIFLPFSCIVSLGAHSQPINSKDYQDSTFGWVKIYTRSETPKPVTLDGVTASSDQMKVAGLFQEWIQQSYLPKGGPGDTKRTVGDDHTFVENKKALPHSYGAFSKTYTILTKDASGKIVPLTGDAYYWEIRANAIAKISTEVESLSSDEHYYFTIQVPTEDGSYKEKMKLSGFDTHITLNKYIHFYSPKGFNNTDAGSFYVVILCKDNKVPWVPITKGEYFNALQESITRWYEYDVAEYTRLRKPEIVTRTKETYKKAKENLVWLKEKYSNSMQEIAELKNNEDPGANDISAYKKGEKDMFDKDSHKSYPVYRIPKETLDQAINTAKPQWIIMYWQPEFHLHESILNNFDFDFAYNYFFGNNKVIEPYKPLRSPAYKQPNVAEKASTAKIVALKDKSIFFFEDFSTTSVGKSAAGWKSTLNTKGKKAEVVELEDNNNHWLELKNNSVSSLEIKTALPQNFQLSFDVSVPKNFTWGGYRMYAYLGFNDKKDEKNPFLKLGLKPGYNGKAGFGDIRENISKATLTTKDFELPGFSNNKIVNKVTMKLVCSSKTFSVFVDNILVYESTKISTINTSLNYLEFSGGESGSDETKKYFISNVKITIL